MSSTADFYSATVGKMPFFEAHPASKMGDPNFAYRRGWLLVAIRPDGLMIYRRHGWLARLFSTLF